MPRILVVHHTVSPPLDTLLQAVLEGAAAGGEAVDGELEVRARPALTCSPVEVLEAEACVLGTPANLGSMSGALKHFFDTIYYPCLDATRRRPWGLYVHGNNDVDGAIRDIERIVTGLEWRAVADPVRVIGAPSSEDTEAAWNLGATVVAALAG